MSIDTINSTDNVDNLFNFFDRNRTIYKVNEIPININYIYNILFNIKNIFETNKQLSIQTLKKIYTYFEINFFTIILPILNDIQINTTKLLIKESTMHNTSTILITINDLQLLYNKYYEKLKEKKSNNNNYLNNIINYLILFHNLIQYDNLLHNDMVISLMLPRHIERLFYSYFIISEKINDDFLIRNFLPLVSLSKFSKNFLQNFLSKDIFLKYCNDLYDSLPEESLNNITITSLDEFLNIDSIEITEDLFIYYLNYTLKIKKYAKNRIHQIVYSKFKSISVSSLRSFISIPLDWLRSASTKLLTQILLSDQGLLAVFCGFLEGMEGSTHLTTIQAQLAKLICTIPKDYNEKTYFVDNLCPQIVKLFIYSINSKDLLMTSSVSLVICRLSSILPSLLIENVFSILFSPILSIISGIPSKLPKDNDMIVISDPNLLSSASDIKHSLLFLSAMIASVPSYRFLGKAIVNSKILESLITILLSLSNFDLTLEYEKKDSIVNTIRNLIIDIIKLDKKSSFFAIFNSMIPDNYNSYSICEWSTDLSEFKIVKNNKLLESAPSNINKGYIDELFSLATKEKEKKSNYLEFDDNNESSLFMINDKKNSTKGGLDLDDLYVKLITRTKLLCDLLQNLEQELLSTDSKSKNKDQEFCISSTLFASIIRSYLLPNEDIYSFCNELVQPPSDGLASPYNSYLLDKSLSGLLMYVFQENIPADLLLFDGLSILYIIESIINGYHFKLINGSIEEDIGDSEEIRENQEKNKSETLRPMIIEIIDSSTENSINEDKEKNDKKEIDKKENIPIETEVFEFGLKILSNILIYGSEKREKKEEEILKSIQQILNNIALICSSQNSNNKTNTLSQLCIDLSFTILQRSLKQEQSNKTYEDPFSDDFITSNPPKSYKEFLDRIIKHSLVKANAPATVAYGLRLISQSIMEQSERLTSLNINESEWFDSIPDILFQSLVHLNSNDPFIHLNSILLLINLIQKLPTLTFIPILVILLNLFCDDKKSYFITQEFLKNINLVKPNGKLGNLYDTLSLNNKLIQEKFSIQNILYASSKIHEDSLKSLKDNEELPTTNFINSTTRYQSIVGEVIYQLFTRKLLLSSIEPLPLIYKTLISYCIEISRVYIPLKEIPQSPDSNSNDNNNILSTTADLFSGKQNKFKGISMEDYDAEMKDNDKLFLRMSSISLLGECLSNSDIMILINYEYELLSIVEGILLWEKAFSQEQRSYRRYSLLVYFYI